MTKYVPKPGDKLDIVTPQPHNNPELARASSFEAVRLRCAEFGLEVGEFRHVSSIPWIDTFDGIKPKKGYWLHKFEAIAK